MKKKSDDQQIIRGLLGKNKYLQVPLDLCKLYGPDATVMLVYILDKIEYKLNIDKEAIENGVVIFRNEFQEQFNLSPYKQRKVENLLISQGILSVEVLFDNLQTFNLYRINIYTLWELTDKITTKKTEPIKV